MYLCACVSLHPDLSLESRCPRLADLPTQKLRSRVEKPHPKPNSSFSTAPPPARPASPFAPSTVSLFLSNSNPTLPGGVLGVIFDPSFSLSCITCKSGHRPLSLALASLQSVPTVIPVGLLEVRSWHSFASAPLLASHLLQDERPKFSECLQTPGQPPVSSLSSPPGRSPLLRTYEPSMPQSLPAVYRLLGTLSPRCLQGPLPCLLQICVEVTFWEDLPSPAPHDTTCPPSSLHFFPLSLTLHLTCSSI